MRNYIKDVDPVLIVQVDKMDSVTIPTLVISTLPKLIAIGGQIHQSKLRTGSLFDTKTKDMVQL